MHKNTSDIFCLEKRGQDGNQIFSIGGSPSFRIRRQRELNTSVFPFGCMGNNKVADVQIPYESAAADVRPPSQPETPKDPHVTNPPPHLPENYEYVAEPEPYAAPAQDAVPHVQVPPQYHASAQQTPEAVVEQTPEPEGYHEAPSFQHKALTLRNPLTGEGIEMPINKRGKRPGHKQPKWSW